MGDGAKPDPNDVEALVVRLVERSVDGMKVALVLGIKGIFAAHRLSEKMKDGDAEQKVRVGLEELRGVVGAGVREARGVLDGFLQGLSVKPDDGKEEG